MAIIFLPHQYEMDHEAYLFKKRTEEERNPYRTYRKRFIPPASPEIKIIVDLIEQNGFLEKIFDKEIFSEQIKNEILERLKQQSKSMNYDTERLNN